VKGREAEKGEIGAEGVSDLACLALLLALGLLHQVRPHHGLCLALLLDGGLVVEGTTLELLDVSRLAARGWGHRQGQDLLLTLLLLLLLRERRLLCCGTALGLGWVQVQLGFELLEALGVRHLLLEALKWTRSGWQLALADEIVGQVDPERPYTSLPERGAHHVASDLRA
jgi:hypothetical protein